MRETGVSKELAREHICNLIDETWKKMNKERINHSLFVNLLLKQLLTLLGMLIALTIMEMGIVL